MKDIAMNKAIDLYLTQLRDKTTPRRQFRAAARTVTDLLAHKALLHLTTKSVSLETPIAPTKGIIQTDEVMLVAILRSGIAMLPTFLRYFRDATVGILGIHRDEKTAEAHLYYQNLPPIHPNQQVIIIDPMIATGGTGCMTISILQKKGIPEEKIMFVGIISASEGIHKIKSAFPNITIIVAAEDKKLNAQKYIVPGLGDFGDRYFGT
jgi:uracil phosphoribosyltransferase